MIDIVKIWNRWRRNKFAVFGSIILLFYVFVAIFAPFLTPFQPLKGDVLASYQPPNATHLFGTDGLGRDILTRIFFGARLTMGLAVITAIFQTVFGGSLGIIAGYFGSVTDLFVQRLFELQLSFPAVIGALFIAATLGPGIFNLVIAMTLFGWAPATRVVRANVLSIREKQYVESARSIGASSWWIISRHVLPNTFSALIVFISLTTAFNILTLAILSFLGYGVPAPNASWGAMLNSAQNFGVLENYWWVWLFPGLAVSSTILSLNFVGDGLRDALDPRYYTREA